MLNFRGHGGPVVSNRERLARRIGTRPRWVMEGTSGEQYPLYPNEVSPPTPGTHIDAGSRTEMQEIYSSTPRHIQSPDMPPVDLYKYQPGATCYVVCSRILWPH